MQREVPFSPPDITDLEISNVVEVLKSGWITTGQQTKLFEKKIAAFCNTGKAVCLNSATAGLELVLRLFGIGPGDEVITCCYTHTSSASVICHVGAKVVFVDTQNDDYHIDYEKLSEAITEKTKAIIPVDIGGVMCDYDVIYEIIEKKKHLFRPNHPYQEALGRILVLADSAHGFGASYKGRKSGCVADFTSFSFHAVKNLTTGEGGAVTWRSDIGLNDDEVYQQFMLLSLHGQSRDALARLASGDCDYDIVMPGFKCNMTNIMAAIGLGQLERYDEILRKREQYINIYNENLPIDQLDIMEHKSDKQCSSFHLYLTRLCGKDMAFRNRFIHNMQQVGITCNIHFKPLPMHTAYKNMGFDIKNYPNAFSLYENEVTLPLNTKMTADDVLYVAEQASRMLQE